MKIGFKREPQEPEEDRRKVVSVLSLLPKALKREV